MERFEDYEFNMSEQPRRVWGRLLLGLVAFLCIAVLYAWWLTTPPASFKQAGEASVTIPTGSSVEAIAHIVADHGLVRSRLMLYLTIVFLHDHKTIYAGTYSFTHPTSVFGVATKLISRETDSNLVRLTIPEGLRNSEVAALVHDALPNIAVKEYMQDATSHEGYLFPDTYLVPPTYTAADLVKLQRDTFTKNIASFADKIAASGFSEAEVVTLASLLEREANSTSSMHMVAGILENRLQADMPLQVDASVSYALDIPQKDLTADDLKYESPYNTYLHAGLPPGPIDNPGIAAIEAVLDPTPSKYYYYITDGQGVFHYAKTLDEHNTNVAKYLKGK